MPLTGPGASSRDSTAPETVDGSPAGRPLRDSPSEPVRATGLGSSLAAWLQRNRERPGGAAEDPRIFELLRAVGADEVREHRLEVESRPDRTYPRRWPDGRRADPVRLDYHGVGLLQAATPAHHGIRAHGPGLLQAATPAHDEIRTRGLGLMFPAHTVHARASTAVVVGNDCELTRADHVHIRQAVIADDDALRSPRVRRVLARAVPGRDNTRVARTLRSTLSRLAERPSDNGPARATCTAEIHDCESVQLGDDAMTRLDSRYVVERTVIPAGALLAGSEDLARRYVALVTAETADPATLASFLCALVGAAENTEDDNLLGYADGLPHRPATLLGLFGLTSIDDMTSIMIGTGDEPHTELDLTTARPAVDDSPAGRLTQPPPAVTTPLAPATGTRPTVPPPVSEPLYRPPAASPPRPAPAAPHPPSRPSATPAPHAPPPDLPTAGETAPPPRPEPGGAKRPQASGRTVQSPWDASPPSFLARRAAPPSPPASSPSPPASSPSPPSARPAPAPPASRRPTPQPRTTPPTPWPPDQPSPATSRTTPQPHPNPPTYAQPGQFPPATPRPAPQPRPAPLTPSSPDQPAPATPHSTPQPRPAPSLPDRLAPATPHSTPQPRPTPSPPDQLAPATPHSTPQPRPTLLDSSPPGECPSASPPSGTVPD
ncbi:hypothetical protein Aph02nite_65590 [Actinoplanes philippinensis]|uniref:hypothetical protein n=1 Tax=Actinoplanes philippinensis TaxID=35752 RepID=UPI000B84E401|nr:hypothetical protein [Actinoplanes philippinensis]GIE80609.1 hypothetical protein Aph02nite_65590 [Actinoplanes philippinensis]